MKWQLLWQPFSFSHGNHVNKFFCPIFFQHLQEKCNICHVGSNMTQRACFVIVIVLIYEVTFLTVIFFSTCCHGFNNFHLSCARSLTNLRQVFRSTKTTTLVPSRMDGSLKLSPTCFTTPEDQLYANIKTHSHNIWFLSH